MDKLRCGNCHWWSEIGNGYGECAQRVDEEVLVDGEPAPTVTGAAAVCNSHSCKTSTDKEIVQDLLSRAGLEFAEEGRGEGSYIIAEAKESFNGEAWFYFDADGALVNVSGESD